MLLKLFVFVVVGVLWTAILWFGLHPDFSQWSNIGLIIGHALPPFSIWCSWLFWRNWTKRNKIRLDEARKQKNTAESKAALEEARNRQQAELQQRRFACDCRIVAISNLVVNDKLELPATGQVLFQTTTADEAKAAHASDNLLEGLETAVTDALRHVYAKCAAAAVLPLYIVSPPDTSIAEVYARIRAIHRRLMQDLALPIALKNDVPAIRVLPQGNTAANAVIDLFENAPNFPGAVILAFDSPLLAGLADQDPARKGKPSHGAFALLMTHTELPAFLKTLAEAPSADISREWLTFSDAGKQVPEQLALLHALPTPLVKGLGSLPVLARVHKTVSAQHTAPSTPELTLLAQTLIERGQINAGMVDLPQIRGEDDAPSADKPAPTCAWLVHNAGTADHSGSNLSAVITALSYFGIDIHPFKSATNSVLQIGDLSLATSLAMLALTLAQAATQKGPVMCAEFSQEHGLTVGFVVPAAAAVS